MTGNWLDGEPMDPAATPAERLPALAGFPFMAAGSCALIVGPTGGGRSSLIEACIYDAALAGKRCAYLGHEVTADEFNARAALIADRRGDEPHGCDLALLAANARYLDLSTVMVKAWDEPTAWIEGVVNAYDLVAIDPLSAVASALDSDFDNSNREFVTFYDRLIQPLTARGVAVALIDNVGHAEDARGRAKGASAKQDKPDLTFACRLHSNPTALAVKATKVRSVRAPHSRDEEWLFVERTQRVERRVAPPVAAQGALHDAVVNVLGEKPLGIGKIRQALRERVGKAPGTTALGNALAEWASDVASGIVRDPSGGFRRAHTEGASMVPHTEVNSSGQYGDAVGIGESPATTGQMPILDPGSMGNDRAHTDERGSPTGREPLGVGQPQSAIFGPLDDTPRGRGR